MKSSQLVRHAARIAHQRRKLNSTARELRSLPDIRHALRLADIQLALAVDALDRAVGEQARRELKD